MTVSVGLAAEHQLSETKMALPEIEDQDMSDSSEDDEEEIKALYARMPDDLAFTLIAMNVRESDFRTLRKLRMDLDTFLTLSEQELRELGVKQGSSLKQVISNQLNVECLHTDKVIFWKPKIKDLRMSSEESCVLMKSVFAQIETVRKFLQELQYRLSVDPPVNYVVTKENKSSDIFGRSTLLSLILARELRQELKYLAKKCDPSQDAAWDKARRGKLEAELEEDKACPEERQTEISTQVNVVGKFKSSRSFIFSKSALAVTTSSLSLFGIWKLWKFVISSKS